MSPFHIIIFTHYQLEPLHIRALLPVGGFGGGLVRPWFNGKSFMPVCVGWRSGDAGGF